MAFWRNQLSGPTDPIRDANWPAGPRKGFFTDTSICIGCKACEVACKEWNRIPTRTASDGGGELSGRSYDNSGGLGANTWRHVAFIEVGALRKAEPVEAPADDKPVRWLMSSDVCKHCTHAGCLDVCPTGALFRSEFGTVVVQADVCNGCGYCVAACPFGVIERREKGIVQIGDGTTEPIPNGGVAQKCTLCYDRLRDGQTPACAQTCPTTSISFGDHDDMVAKARARLAVLHAQGQTEARLYGANPNDGVGGTGSVFLLMDEPEAYGLPPDPVVTTRDLPRMFTLAGMAGTAMIGVALSVFAAFGRMR